MKAFSFRAAACICAAAFILQPSYSQDKTDTAEETSLGHIYTYIEVPEVEQRQVFTEEEIKESHTESLSSFMQSRGIQLLSYGPYGLETKPQLRGFTDETVRVVIDGLCMNNAQYGTFDFTSIDINDIERIEIVRGGFTEGVSDEGSVGGTIYITTKKQSLGTKITSDSSVKTFLNAEFPADTFTQSAGVSSQITENTFAKLNIKGTYAKNKYQFKNFFGKTTTRQNAEVKDLHADAKVSHFFGNGSSFTIGELFYQGDKNCPGEITGAHKGNQEDLNSAFTANLFNPQLLDKFTVENNAAWLFSRRLYDEGTSHSEHIINTFKYAGYASADFTSWYSQSFGLTSDTVFLDSTDDGQHVQPSFCIKGTSKFFPARHITLTLPMAVKICGENTAFVPKAGVKFSFETAEFMLDAYRMIQFPNMDDLYWSGAGAKGNPDLKTEDGWGGEVTFTLKKYLPFTASVFSNYYRNKIQWASSSGILRPRNLASAFYLGFDLRTELSFFDGHFKISANCEYLYTKLLDKSKPESYGKRIMWTPDWTAAASASLIAGDFDLRAEWNYMGRRYTDNTNVTYLEPYSLINFCVSYTGSAHFTPYLRADNILDTEYEAVPSYPMPGISITLGLRIKN